MLPLCREEKIGVIPYSPLASGRLTRDWSSERTLRSQTDQIAKSKYDATAETDGQVVSRVAEIAEQHGVLRVHVALAWCSGRSSDSGRGRLPGRAVCATSHRWSSVKKMTTASILAMLSTERAKPSVKPFSCEALREKSSFCKEYCMRVLPRAWWGFLPFLYNVWDVLLQTSS